MGGATRGGGRATRGSLGSQLGREQREAQEGGETSQIELLSEETLRVMTRPNLLP